MNWFEEKLSATLMSFALRLDVSKLRNFGTRIEIAKVREAILSCVGNGEVKRVGSRLDADIAKLQRVAPSCPATAVDPNCARKLHLPDCCCGRCMGWAKEPHEKNCGCQVCNPIDEPIVEPGRAQLSEADSLLNVCSPEEAQRRIAEAKVARAEMMGRAQVGSGEKEHANNEHANNEHANNEHANNEHANNEHANNEHASIGGDSNPLDEEPSQYVGRASQASIPRVGTSRAVQRMRDAVRAVAAGSGEVQSLMEKLASAEQEARELRIEYEKTIDCGQADACSMSRGCIRHLRERNGELAAEALELRQRLRDAEEKQRTSALAYAAESRRQAESTQRAEKAEAQLVAQQKVVDAARRHKNAKLTMGTHKFMAQLFQALAELDALTQPGER